MKIESVGFDMNEKRQEVYNADKVRMAFEIDDLNAEAKMVVIALSSIANADGVANFKSKDMATICGMSTQLFYRIYNGPLVSRYAWDITPVGYPAGYRKACLWFSPHDSTEGLS